MPTKRPHSLEAAQYREIIDRLIKLYIDQADFGTKRRQTRLVLVLAGIEQEVIDSAVGFKVLHNAGMHNAAVPLVRKAFEFAITAQWMHHVPNAVDAFLAKSAGSAKKLFEETKTAQIILPDDLITEYEKPAETAPDEVKVLRAFERVCNGFAPGKGNGLYLMYRSLSGICHPSVSAVSRHYELESKADAGVVLTLNGGEEETHILNTLAASLVWAGRAIDQNVKDRPRQAALKQAAREMGVPSILKPVA